MLPVNIQSNIEELFEKKFSYKRQGIVCKKLKCIETLSRTWKIDEYLVMKNELNCLKTNLNDKDMVSWHHHTRLVNTAGNIAPEIRRRFRPELCTQAWCKFYEIASTFLNFDNLPCLYSVHLCEAPGAFVTSLNHFLLTRDYHGPWDWIATTLNPYYEGNDIGQMIDEDKFIRSSYNNWYFGEDGTGNLMTDVNLQGLKCVTKNVQVDLVTADGSIDCQFDPAEQEGIVSRLQHCEVLTALHILSPGGTLVVKLFTMFESESICLMYLLNCLFEKVTVFKPCTSKGGNSEVYVISQEFKGREDCGEFLESVTNIYFGDVAPHGCLFQQTDIPDSFFDQHFQCVEFFKNCQMTAIQRNLDLYNKLSMQDNVTFNDPRCHDKVLCHAKQLASNSEVSMKEEICSIASKVKVTESDVVSRFQQEKDYCMECFFNRYYIKPMFSSFRIMKSLNNTRSLSDLRNRQDFSVKLKMEGKFTGSFQERQHLAALPWQHRISMITTYENKVDVEDNSFWIQCMSKQLNEDTFKYFEPVCGKPVNKINSSRFCPGFYISQVQEILKNVQCQSYTQDRRNCLIQKNISEKLFYTMQNYIVNSHNNEEESSQHRQFSDNEFECQEDKQCNSECDISNEPEKETSIKYANNGVNSSHGNDSKSCVHSKDLTCHKNTEICESAVDDKYGQMMIDTDNICLAQDMKIGNQMCVKFIAMTPLTPALKFLADKTSSFENTDTLNSVLLCAVPDSSIDDQFEIKDQASLCEIVLEIIKGCPVNASVIIEMGPSLTRVTAGFVYILYMCFEEIGFVHHHGNLLTRHLVCIAKKECPSKKLCRYLETTRDVFLHSCPSTVLEIVPTLTLLEDAEFCYFLDTSNTNLLQSFITTVINKELKHPKVDQSQQ